MKIFFDHEKLDVYQEAISFCGSVGELLNGLPGQAAAKDQFDRASTSIPRSIAEGNGQFSNADRARFLEMARGAALECAACLDVLVVRKLITTETAMDQKEQLVRIVNLLMGLLKRFSGRVDFLREEHGSYASEQAQEQESKI